MMLLNVYMLSLLLYFLLMNNNSAICSEERSRILVLMAPNAKTHLLSALPLVKRLAQVGHRIHILHISNSSGEEEEKQLQIASPNIIFSHLPMERARSASMKTNELVWHRTMRAWHLAGVYEERGMQFMELLEWHAEKISSLLNSHWELLIVGELFNGHGYGMAQMLSERANVPYVIFCTSMMFSSTAYQRAIGHSWVTVPHRFSPAPQHFFDGYSPQVFRQRLANIFESLIEIGTFFYIEKFSLSPRLAQLTGKLNFKFGNFHAQSQLTILDSISSLGFPQPVVGEILHAGAHCQQPDALLDEKFRNFVEDPSSKGTIYVAFGTFISWDFAPAATVNSFFDAFESFPDYRFIFSFRGKISRRVAANVLLADWAPQLNILAHAKTRIFLTHCGLKSIKESLCTRTPMLAMPMYAEQNHNAKLVASLGIGVLLNKFTVDSQVIIEGINELLFNQTYGQRLNKLQQMFKDRPIDVLDEAALRIGSVIKRNKMEWQEKIQQNFIKRSGEGLNSLEYFSLDLCLLPILLIFLIMR